MSFDKIEMIVTFVTISVCLAFMIAILYKLFRLLQSREIIHAKELLMAKFQFEKELFQAQLEIQEQTFRQISRELHDNVSQGISLAKLGLTTIDLEKPKESENSLIEIIDILEKSLTDIRDISRTMTSDLVKSLGLKGAIESQVGFLQRSGKFHVAFAAECSDLPKCEQKEMIFYRILQESINNIIKHSRCSEISIFLSYIKNELKLLIQDDGKGFDAELVLAGSSTIGGIANMQVRAKLINADFLVESKLGNGTTVSISTTL